VTEHAALVEIAERVSHAIASVDALLLELSAIADDPERVSRVVRAAIDQPDSLVLGAGVIRAASPRPALAWWWRRAGVPAPLAVALDPDSIAFYDVEHRPWFLEPWRTGTLSVVGPYFDRSGTDAMVVTLSRPLAAHPRGIVGADLELDALFRLLVADPSARAHRTVLESAEGRVIASADTEIFVGELDTGPWRAVEHCTLVPWRLVVRKRAPAPTAKRTIATMRPRR